MDPAFHYVLTIFCEDDFHCADALSTSIVTFSHATGKYTYNHVDAPNAAGCPAPLRLRLSTNAFTRSFFPLVRCRDTPFKLAALFSGAPTEAPKAFRLYVDSAAFNAQMLGEGEVVGGDTLLYALDRHPEDIYYDPPPLNPSGPTPTPSTILPTRRHSKRRRLARNGGGPCIGALEKHFAEHPQAMQYSHALRISRTDYSLYTGPRFTTSFALTATATHLPETKVALKGGVLCGGGDQHTRERMEMVARLVRDEGVVAPVRSLPPNLCARTSSPFKNHYHASNATLVVVPLLLLHQWQEAFRRNGVSGIIVVECARDVTSIDVQRFREARVVLCCDAVLAKAFVTDPDEMIKATVVRGKVVHGGVYAGNGVKLTYFWWHRIVIDEVRAFYESRLAGETVQIQNEMATDHMWLLDSKKPAPAELGALVSLLSIYDPPDLHPGFDVHNLKKSVVFEAKARNANCLYVRDSIRTAQLTPSQRALYDCMVGGASTRKQLVAFCNDSSVHGREFLRVLTVDEALQAGLRHHNKMMDEAQEWCGILATQAELEEMDQEMGREVGEVATETVAETVTETVTETVAIDTADATVVTVVFELVDPATATGSIGSFSNGLAGPDPDPDPDPDSDSDSGSDSDASPGGLDSDADSDSDSDSDMQEEELVVSVEQRERQTAAFVEAIEVLSETNTPASTCVICCDREVDTLAVCGHTCCGVCMLKIMRGNAKCPFCRQAMTAETVYLLHDLQRGAATRKPSDEDSPPSKPDVLLKYLRARNRGKETKTVVYVQTTVVAKQLEKYLGDRDVHARVLRAKTKHPARALCWFRDHGDVLLVVLSALVPGFVLDGVTSVVFYHPVAAETIHEEKELTSLALRSVWTPSIAPLPITWLVTRDTVETQMMEN